MSKFKESWELFKQENPTSTTKSIRVSEKKEKIFFSTKINGRPCCIHLMTDGYIIEEMAECIFIRTV